MTPDMQVWIWLPVDGVPTWSSVEATWIPRLDQTMRIISRGGYRDIRFTWIRRSKQRGHWRIEAKAIGGAVSLAEEVSQEECALRIAKEVS